MPASKGACPSVSSIHHARTLRVPALELSSTQDKFPSSHRIPRTGREPTFKQRRPCQRNQLPVMEQGSASRRCRISSCGFLFVMLQGDMSWIPLASFAPLLAGLLRAFNDRWDLRHTFLHHVVGGCPHGLHRLCCKSVCHPGFRHQTCATEGCHQREHRSTEQHGRTVLTHDHK